MKRATLAFALVALLPARARAGDGASARDFDDAKRRGWSWEIGLGPWGGVASDFRARTWTVGGAVDLGVHHVSATTPTGPRSEKGWDLPTIEGLRWCASIGCGMPLLLVFAPSDAILGNEIGFDVRGVAAPDGRVVVRPIFRYAHGVFRTATLASMFLPEIGVAWSPVRANALAFAWTPEAFDVLVDRRHLALGFEPIRVGFLVPLDGARVALEAGTAITLRWVR